MSEQNREKGQQSALPGSITDGPSSTRFIARRLIEIVKSIEADEVAAELGSGEVLDVPQSDILKPKVVGGRVVKYAQSVLDNTPKTSRVNVDLTLKLKSISQSELQAEVDAEQLINVQLPVDSVVQIAEVRGQKMILANLQGRDKRDDDRSIREFKKAA